MPHKPQTPTATAQDMLRAVLLPLSQMMIRRGLGIAEVIEAAKLAYIHAAMAEVIPTGKKVNVSRLAVATGLTRKEIAALLKTPEKSQAESLFKRIDQQRALRVLRGWAMDPLFQRTDGRPKDLEVRGDGKDFATLVKKYGGDVTPVSVLKELERMKAVMRTATGKIRYRPGGDGSEADLARQMAELTQLLKDYASTVRQVYDVKESPVFFGFKDAVVYSPHQAALFQRTYSRRAAGMIESIDQWMAHQAQTSKVKPSKPRRATRIGMGVYLVQEDQKD